MTDDAQLRAVLKNGYRRAVAAFTEQRTRAETAEAAVARVRQLHAETPHNPGTCYCANPYPCPTIRALDSQGE